MSRLSLSLILLSLIAGGFSYKARFDNYQVFRVTPKNAEELQILLELQISGQFNFWNDVIDVGVPVMLMVPPHQKIEFEEIFQENGLQCELSISNLQQLIDEQEPEKERSSLGMEWLKYHNLEDIYNWLDQLAKQYKEVKVVVGGKSYEGREIRGIEINFGKNLTNVFLEAGIHAREWISPAATTWMVKEILNSTSDSIFRQFNYLYFPIYNPDGYVFSWEKNRLWRKTRTPYKSGTRMCYGADPNRNWDSHWGVGDGMSKDPCSETYAGPRAFSEVETRSMADYMRNRTDRRSDVYLAFHSYSQLLMFPWGYTTKPAKENDIWQRIGNKAAEAIKSCYGKSFKVGPISTTIYKVSGSSLEWVYEKMNSFIPFVFELRDTGKYGFMLPPDQIIPSGVEVVAAVKTILEEYKKIRKY